MNILVTGGAGFIGSNFIHHVLEKYPDYYVVCIDKLTYAGNKDNISDFEDNSRFTFVQGDIGDRKLLDEIILKYSLDGIVNFAAETHVDRSITGPSVFVDTNIGGTQVLLDAALNHGLKKYHQISTDEVYGELGDEGTFTENSPIQPRNPYAASKASADMLVLSYFHTYQLPAVITRCSNNYGPRQYPEKLIPLFVKKLLANKKVPIYGSGKNVRDWINVKDHCRAIDLVFHEGKIGEVYNIGGGNEKNNIEITQILIKLLGKSDDLMEFVEDRKGHDFRYSMDYGKINRELGWKPEIDFDEGMKKAISWYKDRVGLE